MTKQFNRIDHGWSRSTSIGLLLGLALILAIAPFAQAGMMLTTLAAFNSANGAMPNSLIRGADGNLYGTTVSGGTNGGYGTVFQLTTNHVLNTLFSFSGTNGSSPVGITQGADGNFYGNTFDGGASDRGTVFQLTQDGVLTTLVSFNGTNGAYPYNAPLLNPANGCCYGTTLSGGSNNQGTLFQLSTNSGLSTLVTFNGSNGESPYGALALGRDGNFYGTTLYGGANNDNGTVYRVDTNGNLTTLVSFDHSVLGANPYAGVIQGLDGNFYGTTYLGGSNSYGTVYKMDPNGNVTVLVSFDDVIGSSPYCPLLQETNGNIFGATLYGGTNNDNGTVFEIATNGAFTTLWAFGDTNRPADGTLPFTSLVQGTDGNLYGTTYTGGTNGSFGTIYQISSLPSVILKSPTLAIRPNGTNLNLTWNSQPGVAYQLQASHTCTNTGTVGWINVGAVVNASNVVTSTTDAITSNGQHFYRLLVVPPTQ